MQPKSSQERYIKGGTFVAKHAADRKAIWTQAQAEFKDFVDPSMAGLTLKRGPVLEYDVIKAIYTDKSGGTHIAVYDQDVNTNRWNWELLPGGRIR